MLKFNSLYEFIDEFFYGENVYIRNCNTREVYSAEDMSIQEINEYPVDAIDGITMDEVNGEIVIVINIF